MPRQGWTEMLPALTSKQELFEIRQSAFFVTLRRGWKPRSF